MNVFGAWADPNTTGVARHKPKFRYTAISLLTRDSLWFIGIVK